MVGIADVATIFKSAGLILKTSTSRLSAMVHAAESVSSLPFMPTWLGTHIKVNCNPRSFKMWNRASISFSNGSSVPVLPKAVMKFSESVQMAKCLRSYIYSSPTLSLIHICIRLLKAQEVNIFR